jgi:cardiolipin synthase
MRRSVHLTNAYFVPDPRLVGALQDAARRKVDVKLILPGHRFLAPYVEDSLLSLLRGKIYERRRSAHAKTGYRRGLVHGGSSNLDWRSFLHNDELDAVVLGPEFGVEMEAAFEKDLAESTRIELSAWSQRPLGSRLRELGGRMWEYLL